jgi:hypothetical protein
MGSELTVRALINSSVEDVLGWKCCNLQDMNLEVQVNNGGGEAVRVKSAMELESGQGSEKIEYLYPPGLQPIGPREGLSFYCRFDEERFRRFSHIIIEDERGRRYRAEITGRSERAERVDRD